MTIKAGPFCFDIWSRSIREASYCARDQTGQSGSQGNEKWNFFHFLSWCSSCSVEKKVMLQLITDNKVNMMGADTMMWSNAKKWLTAEKTSCEPKQFLLTCNFTHPANNISSQFYQWDVIPPRSICQWQEMASNHFVHTNKSIVDYYFSHLGSK